MARKKVKKAQWVPEEGGRLIKGGYFDEDDDALREETIQMVLDDAGARAMGEKAHALRGDIAALKGQVAALKKTLVAKACEESKAVTAIIERRYSERREVYCFADDAAEVVKQYDATTKELLGTRELEWHEKQEELDLDADGERDAEAED